MSQLVVDLVYWRSVLLVAAGPSQFKGGVMTKGNMPSEAGDRLAERLNYLFQHMHPPTGPYTNAHVAREISRKPQEFGGVSLTEQYLSMLRKGQRTNPNPALLRALAMFFGVHVGYLLGDLSTQEAARVEDEVQFFAAMRDSRVRAIALRSVGLPPQVQDSLKEIISQFREQMNLPADPSKASNEDKNDLS